MINQFTMVGNLVADPEMRNTNNGKTFTTFTVAYHERYFDKQANEWKDGDASFIRVTCWNRLAEHAAQTLRKGMNVIVAGTLKTYNYESQSGEKRMMVEVTAESIGVTFMSQQLTVEKRQPSQQSYAQQRGYANQQQYGGPAFQQPPVNNQQAQDPWASQPAQDGWSQGEPAF